ESMFVRLIKRPDRIIEIRRPALFDMSAENVRDDLALSEFDESADARGELRKVPGRNIEPAGIHAVTGQQNARLPVVQRHAQLLMPRTRYDIDYSAAQIDCPHPARPILNSVKLCRTLDA